MKAVAFNTSPRKGGNTELLLNTVLEAIAAQGIETELVQVGSKIKRGCTACCKCRENLDKKCVFDDDIVNECIAKMIEADAIIIGSPTYFADITAEAKALIDRAGYVTRGNGNLLKRKVAAGVIAARRAGSVHSLDSLNHMFLISEMVIAGSTYWNLGMGAGKGEAADDAEGMANMKNLGENIAWLLKKINS